MKTGDYLDFKGKFPDSPIPNKLFRHVHGGEFEGDILKHLSSKKWTAVDINDWIYTAGVEIIADCLTPKAFHYYVPSILIESLKYSDYLDWGVRAVLPHNQKRKPKGKWWNEFYSLFNDEQREIIREYLSHVIQISPEYSESKYLAEIGLNSIWSD